MNNISEGVRKRKIVVRLTQDEYLFLKYMAEDNSKNLSDFVRKILFPEDILSKVGSGFGDDK